MDGVFLGGSLIAAFLAGSVALFAPCCIVFMFPAYLGAAVRNRRWRLVPLTLIFAAGLALVLVPATLGIGLLTRPLLRYHGFIYAVGGILLVVFAVLAVTGKTWALPMLRGSPDIQRTDSAGVFALGVFSGAASSCCAPVLAGVVTLSAVAPSVPQATAIGLAYVFGMVFPLLIMTLLWDRSSLKDKEWMRGRDVTWHLGGRPYRTNTINVATGALMGLMGAGLFVIAVTGTSLTSSVQVGVSAWIEDRLLLIVEWLAPIPDWLAAAGLIAFAFAAVSISGRRRAPAEPFDHGSSGRTNCHEHSDETPEPAAASLTHPG